MLHVTTWMNPCRDYIKCPNPTTKCYILYDSICTTLLIWQIWWSDILVEFAKVKEDLKWEETDYKMGNLRILLMIEIFYYFYCIIIIIMVVIYYQLPCKVLPPGGIWQKYIRSPVLFFLTTACESTIFSK